MPVYGPTRASQRRTDLGFMVVEHGAAGGTADSNMVEDEEEREEKGLRGGYMG